MADWFVDSSATGTNSGTSATNAAIDINSLTFGGQVAFGDRVWVRRTMHWQANSFICGRSGFNPLSHSPIEIIGWPSSGDPFFNERPSVPTWDADAALYSNLPWPVLITSGTGNQALMTLRNGLLLTNFTFTTTAAFARTSTFGTTFGFNDARAAGKFCFLNVQPRGGEIIHLDEIVYIGSGSALDMGCMFGSARRFTIPASYVGEAPLFANDIQIGDIINLSNSISNISVKSVAAGGFIYSPGWVGNISGVQPLLNPFESTGLSDVRNPVAVGNYYGQGPCLFGGQNGAGVMKTAVASTAIYSGALAQQITAQSISPSTSLFFLTGHTTDDCNEHLGQPIRVSSGVRVTATAFFYHVGVGSLERSRTGWMQLTGQGGGRLPVSMQTASAGIYAGSAGLWSGSSIGAGSAYIIKHSWVPTETTTAYLFARFPLLSQMCNPACVQLYVAPFFLVQTG